MRTLKDKLRRMTFNHIQDVLDAFELCENLDDVEEVIGYIPNRFGIFHADLRTEDGKIIDPNDPEAEELDQYAVIGFRITNIYDLGEEEEYDFDWAD